MTTSEHRNGFAKLSRRSFVSAAAVVPLVSADCTQKAEAQSSAKTNPRDPVTVSMVVNGQKTDLRIDNRTGASRRAPGTSWY